MNLLSYYDKGVAYPEYFAQFQKDIDQKAQYYKYTHINKKRSERVAKTFKLSEDRIIEIQSLPYDFKVLVISEVWCGDAAQLVPIFQKIFDYMKVSIRYISRDSYPELMQEYLTHGSASIPILVAMDETAKEIFRYGPRPEKAMKMLAIHKENPEVYTKEEFQMDLQKFYNKDKGESIYQELYQLMTENLL